MTLGSGHGLLRALLSMLSVPAFALMAFETSLASEGREAGRARFSQAAEIFQGRCGACHTYGRGTKVGPDLKGVTERRTRAWLLEFIRASSAMIAAGDPTATALFTEFKKQRMPDWSDLTEGQVGDLLDYLASGGPEIGAPDERHAESATPGEAERGRLLFDGEVGFAHGMRACSSCHAARGSRWMKGGSLGPDLSPAYLRYQDKALTSFLRRRCFRWAPAIDGPVYLTPEESFAVKAFLRRSALLQESGGNGR